MDYDSFMVSSGPLTPKKILTLLGLTLLLLIVLAGITLGLGRPAQAATTQTPVMTVTPSLTATQTSPPLPTATSTPLPTLTATPILDSFHITGITGHRQVYHLGCEASASVDWANYFNVTIYEYTFQTSLPHSDNPDYGFVGDVNSVWGQVPPYAYGVYAGPVADLLRQYGLPAKAVKDYTLTEVKQKLAESKPIIVWVIGNMEGGIPAKYTDAEGRTTVVAAYEHVVILTGYDQNSIRYMTNGRFYDTPTDVFLNSWGVLGNMAVIYDD